jgi:dephospho-CoA kinase
MPKIIIGLVGLQASGKGTAAKYLSEKYGASTHRFSTMLRDVLNRLYIDISRDNLQILSSMLRGNFGEDLMARVIAKDVENDKNEIVIVDGVRRFTDLFYLEKIANFKLVSIETSQSNRYQRLVNRGENTGDKEKTLEQFVDDEKREADREIPDVMKTATTIWNNDQDLKDLHKQIDELLK